MKIVAYDFHQQQHDKSWSSFMDMLIYGGYTHLMTVATQVAGPYFGTTICVSYTWGYRSEYAVPACVEVRQ